MAEPHTVRLGQQPDGDRLFHAGDGLVERPTGNGGDGDDVERRSGVDGSVGEHGPGAGVGVESVGCPSLAEDGWADEYVAITVDVAEVIKGELVERVVLGWDAILVGPGGDRVATLLSNGIRPPQVGDQMLLFLDPAAASFVEALSGAPTHSPVLLEGVAYLDGDRLVAGETSSTPADQLLAMSLPQVRRIVQEAAAHPREVGAPIQPGGL